MLDDKTSKECLTIEDIAALKHFADKLQIAVLVFNHGQRLKYANKIARDLLKIDNGAIEAGLKASELVAEEQGPLVKEALSRLNKTIIPIPMSLHVSRKNGSLIPMEVFANPIYDNTEHVGYLVYAVDMRRRERIAERLAEENVAFRTIVERSHHGFFIVDDNYKFIYANDGMLKILRATRSEVVGHDFREFLHPDSVALVTEYYLRRQRGEKLPSRYRFKIRRKDGKTRVVLLTATVIVDVNGRPRTVGQLEDLTETVESQEQLELSRERYRTLVETMKDGLGIDDANGIMTYCNPALVQMLGYDSAGELIGRPIGTIIRGMSGERLKQVIEKRKKGITETYEAQLIHKSGRYIPALISASPLFDPDGNFIGTFGLMTDLSELKGAEAEARFLLDLLLHDFGNHMQAILTGLEMISETDDRAQILKAKKYSLESVNRCLELVKKIRTAELTKDEKTVPVNLVEILKKEARHLEMVHPVTVYLENIPDTVMVTADRALNQLFWNLLDNAARHNPKDEKKVWIEGQDTDGIFVVSISDNGPGLRGLKKEHLFNPERRFGGAGLHLVNKLAMKYRVKVVVEERIEGRPEEGLRISLHFPKV